MIKFIKKFFPFQFKRSVKDHLGVPSMHWSLQNLKKAGYIPSAAIDGGAYEGQWTLDFLEVFPDTQIMMIEAQPGKETVLTKTAADKPYIKYAIQLLSSADDKELLFYENDTASHVHEGEGSHDNVKRAIAKTLDTVLKQNDFPAADFLKLDVQGHELEVLKGAPNTLRSAQFCMLEVTVLSIGGYSPLLIEAIKFMDDNNFQLYDITQFIRRPFDKALYQMDVIFIKKDSKYITGRQWN